MRPATALFSEVDFRGASSIILVTNYFDLKYEPNLTTNRNGKVIYSALT